MSNKGTIDIIAKLYMPAVFMIHTVLQAAPPFSSFLPTLNFFRPTPTLTALSTHSSLVSHTITSNHKPISHSSNPPSPWE